MNRALIVLFEWADSHEVELDNVSLVLATSETMYVDQWDSELDKNVKTLVPRETLLITGSFDFATQSPENLRRIKRAFGGALAPRGYAPYVRLEGKVEMLPGLVFKATLNGAYECEYTCRAAAHPGLVSELSDGKLGEAMREDEIKAALS